MHLEGDESEPMVPDAFLCLAARPSALLASGGNRTQPESRSLQEIVRSGKAKVAIMRVSSMRLHAIADVECPRRLILSSRPGQGWISQNGSRMP